MGWGGGDDGKGQRVKEEKRKITRTGLFLTRVVAWVQSKPNNQSLSSEYLQHL